MEASAHCKVWKRSGSHSPHRKIRTGRACGPEVNFAESAANFKSGAHSTLPHLYVLRQSAFRPGRSRLRSTANRCAEAEGIAAGEVFASRRYYIRRCTSDHNRLVSPSPFLPRRMLRRRQPSHLPPPREWRLNEARIAFQPGRADGAVARG